MKPHLPIPLRRKRNPMLSTLPGYPHFGKVPVVEAVPEVMAPAPEPVQPVEAKPDAVTGTPVVPESDHATPQPKKSKRKSVAEPGVER